MLFIFSLALLFSRVGAAVAATNTFGDLPTTGPTNPLYRVGQSAQLSWTMNFTGAKLTLDQDKAGDKIGGASAVLLQNTNLQSMRWNVSYEGLDPSISRVFYFTVSDGDNDDNTFSSHYMYIFDEEDKQQQQQQQPQDCSTAGAVASASASANSNSDSDSDSGYGGGSDNGSGSNSGNDSNGDTGSNNGNSSNSSSSSNSNSNTCTGLSSGAIVGITIVTTLATVAAMGATGFFARRWLRDRITAATAAGGLPKEGLDGNGATATAGGMVWSEGLAAPPARPYEAGGAEIAELHALAELHGRPVPYEGRR
ncbi:hypothetical protein GGR52DRAFT_550582 [Hypoxylon sp. FL1284]|nr:hypothetical protein GGR52DRAFT_550582 [Hypoxylon sp. FL1284]